MKCIYKIVIGLTTVFCLLTGIAIPADAGSAAPVTNDGKKWRIGYYEGGPYITYQKTLTALVKGLMEAGWIETAAIPEQSGEETADLWGWLAKSAKSPYLTFVKDAHYSANWENDRREKMAAEILERLRSKGDIDLMIAAGTWAGEDLAVNDHSTPTVVVATSEPVAAGIIKSVEDSGYDHVHATVQPNRHKRQLEIFHDIVGFKRLGVAYEDTTAGRSIAAIDDIKKFSGERGFDVVECHTIDSTPDRSVAEKSVEKCFNELVDKTVDAVYVVQQLGINDDNISKLVDIFISSKTPTFSQVQSSYVKAGLLMSISQVSFDYSGEFHAEVIGEILNGALPREVGQVFNAPKKIAINLKTADAIGLPISPAILKSADEIFETIVAPE